MVDVVTQKQAQEQHAEEMQAAEVQAAAEMAAKAQEKAVEDKPAESEKISSEQKQWDDILVDDEDELEDALPEDATPGLEEPEATEEPAPEETPDEETPPAEEVPAAEETPAEEAETPEVEVPEVPEPEDTRTPEEVQAEVAKARETAQAKLEESFTWTEEQAELFETDPGKVMSQMAAQLYLDIFDSISKGLQMQMPGMVNGIMKQQAAIQANEQRFFNAWPQLAKAEYRQTVDRIAKTYRQQYPQVDDATAIKEIGAQAWVALKLPLDELVTHTQGTVEEVSAPVITPPTHVPASAGNAPQAAKAPARPSANEYEQLANELLQDDDM